jgi:hypothetical protein
MDESTRLLKKGFDVVKRAAVTLPNDAGRVNTFQAVMDWLKETEDYLTSHKVEI